MRLSDREQFGEPGSPIDGSRMYRGYCVACGEPMRVASPEYPCSQTCLECKAHSKFSGSVHPSIPSSEREYQGGQFYNGEW